MQLADKKVEEVRIAEFINGVTGGKTRHSSQTSLPVRPVFVEVREGGPCRITNSNDIDLFGCSCFGNLTQHILDMGLLCLAYWDFGR